MSIWDDPELRAGGEFVKFEKPGDTVSGVINAVRAHRFDDGQVAPQILITTDEGEDRTITAGQVRLKSALAEQRPEAGDRISITFTQEEKRAGGKTLKHFDVAVTRGGTPAVAQPAATATATPEPQNNNGPDPQALAAAVANLSTEQKAALGIPT